MAEMFVKDKLPLIFFPQGRKWPDSTLIMENRQRSAFSEDTPTGKTYPIVRVVHSVTQS
jgi:hypothetical protein